MLFSEDGTKFKEGDEVINRWNSHCGVGEILGFVTRAKDTIKAIVAWPAYGPDASGFHELEDLAHPNSQSEDKVSEEEEDTDIALSREL